MPLGTRNSPALGQRSQRRALGHTPLYWDHPSGVSTDPAAIPNLHSSLCLAPWSVGRWVSLQQWNRYGKGHVGTLDGGDTHGKGVGSNWTGQRRVSLAL